MKTKKIRNIKNCPKCGGWLKADFHWTGGDDITTPGNGTFSLFCHSDIDQKKGCGCGHELFIRSEEIGLQIFEGRFKGEKVEVIELDDPKEFSWEMFEWDREPYSD